MFARQITTIDSSGAEGLLAAATAVAMHEMPEADLAAVSLQLQHFADEVAARVPRQIESLRASQPVDPEPVLAHIHEVLFEEAGFRGNMDDYFNPRNSYVPAVLEGRSGIPVTLTLIYKVIAERLGLTVHGINTPGHFLAAIDPPPQFRRAANGNGACCSRMYIDVFNHGRVLTKPEVFDLLEQSLGRSMSNEKGLLCPADNRQWVNRILQNLQNIFTFTRREADLAAMQEMTALLQTPVR